MGELILGVAESEPCKIIRETDKRLPTKETIHHRSEKI